MTSQFITYPDLINSPKNHPVLIIDANQYQIEDIGLFCKVADETFDIYLYRHEVDDLQWLNEVSQRVSTILLSSDSKVTVSLDNVIMFGNNTELMNPLGYFQQYTSI